jgi:hypothetical protein
MGDNGQVSILSFSYFLGNFNIKLALWLLLGHFADLSTKSKKE